MPSVFKESSCDWSSTRACDQSERSIESTSAEGSAAVETEAHKSTAANVETVSGAPPCRMDAEDYACGLQALVTGDVEHEHRCAAERDLHRIWHVELAGLHDRRHRIDEFAPRVTRLADHPKHIFDLILFHTYNDRRVALLQEAAGRVQPRHAVFLLGELVDEGAGVLGVDDREDEFHGPG